MPERLHRYPLADLVAGRRLVYRVGANWKLVAENYNECYHCAGVHPGAVQGGAGIQARRVRAGDEDERTRHKGELVYPNLMLSLSADHVAAFTLWPHRPDATTVVCELLFPPDEVARPGFYPSDAADFWDLVNRQDWAMCESVQRGMGSRSYSGGWFAPMVDASLDIRRYLLERLEEGSGEPWAGP